MKNKEIEEFDKKQLEELLKRLKDINNFTGFKDGAFKYYLGKYEADLLLSYIKQLENNRDKAIKYIKNNYDFYYGDELYDQYIKIINILKGDSDE
jgi:hypothetical protein